ncbi:hypothetical protein HJC23_013950 [Cyclotella cryptica]|uniref:Uncharacterized protein n=1 Tax=Cyclotella cryptica TaxID=29204 RepID=A0ABD3Q344_9STRA
MKQACVRKRVSFGASHSVITCPMQPSSETISSPSQTKLKDPLPRERRVQQLIARKAVLSFQRYLQQSHAVSSGNDDQARLAEISAKFSRRAKDVALETARVNFLEAHSSLPGGQCPRFSSERDSLNVDVPFPLTEFPSVKLTRKVSFDDANAMMRTKRQRVPQK